jgi:hypothetical protein
MDREIHPAASRPFRANRLIGWFPGLNPGLSPPVPLGQKWAFQSIS